MFLTKKHLSRRTVLKGAGVSLALPLLDAMIPGATADRWTPSGSGANFKLSEILSPLEPHKHLVASFAHLENKANQNSVHSIVPATWLSGMRPDSASQGANMSTTIDQMIAEHIGQETTLPSLEIASETTTQAAACPSGAGCYYSTTLSFRNATSPLPMEFNPRKVFTQLFGEGDTDA